MSNKSNKIAGNHGHFVDGATVVAWRRGGCVLVKLRRFSGSFTVEAV
jgi:hypothetical protein